MPFLKSLELALRGHVDCVSACSRDLHFGLFGWHGAGLLALWVRNLDLLDLLGWLQVMVHQPPPAPSKKQFVLSLFYCFPHVATCLVWPPSFKLFFFQVGVFVLVRLESRRGLVEYSRDYLVRFPRLPSFL